MNVHCAASSVNPLHWMGAGSKLRGGGGFKVRGFAMTLTAEEEDREGWGAKISAGVA